MIQNKLIGGFSSKTMWFGLLVIAANWLNNNVEMFQGFVPKQYDDLVLYVIGIVVWVLRWVTTKPIEEKRALKKSKTADDVLEEALQENDNFLKDF